MISLNIINFAIITVKNIPYPCFTMALVNLVRKF